MCANKNTFEPFYYSNKIYSKMQDSNFFLYSLIGGFLLINLIIGLKSGKSIKTLRDYAIANKSYGVGALIMTYLATQIGSGSIFRVPNEIYKDGFLPFFAVLGYSLSFIYRVLYISPKMYFFRDCITMGDMFYKMYGDKVRAFIGIISVVVSMLLSTMQISIIGMICYKFAGLDRNLSIIIGGLSVAIYSAFGGMRAVTATDIFQFVLMSICIALFTNVIVDAAGGTSQILISLPKEKFDIFENSSFYGYFTMFFMFGFLSAEMQYPAVIQRMLMAKNTKSLKEMFIYIGFSDLSIRVMIALIGLAAVILYPNGDNPEIISSLYFDFINPIVQPIIFLGLLAIIFSSADSHMHAAGVSFANDLVIPFRDKGKDDLDNEKNVKLAVYSTLLVGFIGIIVALGGWSITEIWTFIVQILGISVVFPMLFGIAGLRSTQKDYFIAFFVALLSIVICKLTLSTQFSALGILISTIINGLILLGLHVYNNGKIVFEKRSYEDFNPTNLIPEAKCSFFQKIIKLPTNYLNNCKYQLEESKDTCILFGVVYLIYTIIPIFFWRPSMGSNTNEILYMKIIAICICCLLITKDIWNDSMKKFLPIFWQISIVYCLPFISTIMFIFTNGSTQWLTSIAINIIFMFLLTDWRNCIFNIVAGVVGAFFIAKTIFHSDLNFNISIDNASLISYQIIFGVIIGLLFARKKQIFTAGLNFKAYMMQKIKEDKEDELQKAKGAQNNIIKNIGGGRIDVLESLETAEELLQKKDIHSAQFQLEIIKQYIERVVEKATTHMRLNVEKVKITDLISHIESLAQIAFKDRLSIVSRCAIQEVECDKKAIDKIILQSLYELSSNIETNYKNENSSVFINIADTTISYSSDADPIYNNTIDAFKIIISTSEHLNSNFLSKKYFKKLVSPNKILAEPKKLGSNEKTQLLADKIAAEQLLDAQYGVSEYLDENLSYTYVFVFPQKIWEIRPKPMDLDIPEDKIKYWPEAIALESRFKEELKLKAPKINLKKVIKALDYIRTFHFHQERKSGEPYYMHPVEVTRLVLCMIDYKSSKVYELLQENQENIILASLLHDVLEDTALENSGIQIVFGYEVANMVMGLTKINREGRPALLTNVQAFSNLIKQDAITICIKLADRLHNIMTIDGHPSEEKRRAVAEETLDFFIKPAQELGFDYIASDLESACKYVIKNGELAGFSFKSA